MTSSHIGHIVFMLNMCIVYSSGEQTGHREHTRIGPITLPDLYFTEVSGSRRVVAFFQRAEVGATNLQNCLLKHLQRITGP